MCCQSEVCMENNKNCCIETTKNLRCFYTATATENDVTKIAENLRGPIFVVFVVKWQTAKLDPRNKHSCTCTM